jgi:5-methylcytosine-specific restriction endonuclease McrA
LTRQGRRAVFDKTQGHCHFCGDKLVFKHYEQSAWELDHVIQKKKGGASSPDNYLPACGKCNHLRWHRTGKDLRRLILLGLTANDEIKAGTALGNAIHVKFNKRKAKSK